MPTAAAFLATFTGSFVSIVSAGLWCRSKYSGR